MDFRDFDFFISLVHYPVLNKKGEIVSTSITNLDVHDIARVAKTVGVKEYYLITPIKEQLSLLDRMLGHWYKYEKLKSTDRASALSSVYGIKSFYDLIEKLKNDTKKDLVVISTSAKAKKKVKSVKELVATLEKTKAYLIVFGTGWGLSDEIIKESDILLEPIDYGTGFNHLSVRSAVSIILDRIYLELKKRL